MIKVLLTHLTDTDDLDFILSEYVSWLIMHAGPRGMAWWLDRSVFGGTPRSVSFFDATDATAFKLRFEL